MLLDSCSACHFRSRTDFCWVRCCLVLDRIGLGRFLDLWIGSALLGVSTSAARLYICSVAVSLCKYQVSDLMDCGLEGAPVVTSGDNSPTSAACTGIALPLEKPRDSVDETCEAAEGGSGLQEAQICTGFSKSISLEMKKASRSARLSLPLLPTLKLISAMKGGHEKNGMASPTENRHVKWAPDVYDPPVTSVCHSVGSSYQRRSKSCKKEKNKQKKQKGKSKKNHQNSIQNSSVLQAPDLGLKVASTTGGQSSVDSGNHEAVIMDYSMGNQEAKCGSSFLRESVAKMHFSITEAS